MLSCQLLIWPRLLGVNSLWFVKTHAYLHLNSMKTSENSEMLSRWRDGFAHSHGSLKSVIQSSEKELRQISLYVFISIHLDVLSITLLIGLSVSHFIHTHNLWCILWLIRAIVSRLNLNLCCLLMLHCKTCGFIYTKHSVKCTLPKQPA